MPIPFGHGHLQPHLSPNMMNFLVELKLNVKMPATDRQFLIVVPGNAHVKDLYPMIDAQHLKLFKQGTKTTMIKNEYQSVVDEEYMVHKVFADGDTIEAHGSVSTASGGKSKGKHALVPSDFDAASAISGAAAAAASAAAPAPASKKPKKDPNAPKRPPNAFMQFAAMRREQALAEADNTQARGPEFMKQLGVEWAALTEEQKAPFKQKSDAMLSQYNEAKNAYRETASLEEIAPAEQPKKLIRRLMRKHGMQVTDRDEVGLRQVLLEYNVTKNANKTKKWLVKQLNKICDKDSGAPLDLAPSLGLPPTMGMPPVPYHYQHLPSSM